MTLQPEEIRAALSRVRQEMDEACARCGRNPTEVTLLAVSKTHPPEAVLAAMAGGQLHFGENKVQELRDKAPAVRDLAQEQAQWHLIGPLQTNKAKYLPGIAEVVHTVSRMEEAVALEKAFAKADADVSCYVQVNVGGEEQKNGVSSAALWPLLESLQDLRRVKLLGLMTIPPYHDDPEAERPYYLALRGLRDQALQRGFATCRGLSMGMSHDFAVAIEEGATIVRVGSAIFGERQ